jgi:hypothetical protein
MEEVAVVDYLMVDPENCGLTSGRRRLPLL